MSVDIDWKTLTTGPEGLALAESVRDFIHDKFQQVKLPKFIRTVQVHSFEFGDEAPTVVLKDVCDPLDEFYESDDESELDGGTSDQQSPCDEQISDGTRQASGKQFPVAGRTAAVHVQPQEVDGSLEQSHGSLQSRRGVETQHQLNTTTLSAHDRMSAIQQIAPISSIPHQQRPGALRSLPSFVDQLASPLLNSRSGTPGIPGGTANLSYFHHTPFSHHPGHHHQPSFPAPWSDYNFGKPGIEGPRNQSSQPHFGQIHRQHHQSSSPQLQPLTALGQQQQHQSPEAVAYSAGDPSTRPSTATTQTPLSRVPTGTGSQQDDPTPPRQASSKLRKGRRSSYAQAIPSSPPPLPSPGLSSPSRGRPEPNPQDMQLVLHVRYSGGIRLSLSAEILLDYPMSSFVSIPLQLTITGITFDGVAIVAHVRPPFEVEKARNEALALEREIGGDIEPADQQNGSKGRAHICFLSPEDANALLGAEDVRDLTLDNIGATKDHAERNELHSSPVDTPESPTIGYRGGPSRKLEPVSPSGSTLARDHAASATLKQATTYAPAAGDSKTPGTGENAHEGLGGLLREIRVESEIGQRRDGQQSLRNVGKVEKFVVEQVRRIFEEEFVWPSFWTFLL